MNNPYFLIEPKGKKVPVILSVPHSGVEFPEELKSHYRPEMAAQPDDTDWYVHDLYNFVPELGITVIHARYSRWVIDLNRDPASKPLYDDGRIITGLTSSTDFFGNEIYIEKRFVPDSQENERRLANYYRPYYQKIESLLTERIAEFGKALLWDAHSIRRIVPTIRKEPFPDLILGDNDGQSADVKIIEIALNGLRAGKYGVNHNEPFKGGQITRHFGKPRTGVHALQLEMAKTNYMKNDELTFDNGRAEEVRNVLRPIFEQLISHLTK
ncbi:MAG: N-formylglutamate amidohydrolase [Acidobacteriota bacterium]|nr:N-formylglutamate amidohydrolase [Acidobacteriota bacterium]